MNLPDPGPAPGPDPFSAPGDPKGKRAIITAALHLFAMRGVDGVSIRDIGDAANLSNPALFRHFKSKEELAFHLFQTGYGRLTGIFDAPPAADGDPVDQTFLAGMALIEQSPHGVHFVLDNTARFFRQLPDEMRTRSLLNRTRHLLAEAQAQGALRRDNDPDLAAIMFLGALSQVARMALFGELRQPPTVLAPQLLQLLYKGLEDIS
jgi:AcrR family transcriptional regulator